MATSGKCAIPPDVGEAPEESPAQPAPEGLDPTPRSAATASDASSENDRLVRSFLMTLLRALSAWST